MKHHGTAAVTAAALAGALALTGCTGQSAGGGDTDDSTLTIWHYENEDSAMGKAWAKAIEIFEEEHPDVTVDVEKQTFEQIQKNAKIVLTGDDVPDVMEFNKGNATAGQLAAQGLLAPLTDAAEERGWAEKLPGSLATTARYDEQGLMGSGDWYGVPNYGEFVGVYYNKDMFADLGLEVPTTLDELEDVLAAFKAEGVTPLAEAGAEYPLGQLWYELVLAHGDRALVDDYQLFANDVDFHDDAMTQATETLDEWIDKGYIAADSAALTAEDMGVSFIDGTYPIMVSGSWWFGRLATEMQADWGQFNFPGNTLHTGSSGNLWVVPANADSPSLAEEFIDITLRPEVQDVLAVEGGLPVAGDASAIEDERTRELTENFQAILDEDGLAYYPDWPVAGYYDVLVSELQSLVNRSKTPDEVLDGLQGSYEDGKADLLDG
ncbi:ABC transporter substrate-binding protein [Promicromonospora citrea]|uniref:Sugar ABC transporter substrate-binding protein n=1 Tax=Promicromonospora citrea TaxID=43677 RepID=A0A8H9GHL8_9MICO|nr:extracellular solute-binding protein [Promicromonospora citrea]NNH51144.1 extracellular solute-binding protein [Promicromonospora citrea]GGM26911.1 sugar ABC transporter substrate-binding protein [Promicromonospora citrea]